ncbi:MAG: hypothetical protein HS116_04555 [Planctomycetes bacterium]|nr:hypothetical protein [Planctomycetota bacterium]
MHAEYVMRCERCGYEAADRVLHNSAFKRYEIMTCTDCEEVVQVLITELPYKVIKTLPNGIQHVVVQADQLIDHDPECPHCHGPRVEPWEDPKCCPKCRQRMVKRELDSQWN